MHHICIIRLGRALPPRIALESRMICWIGYHQVRHFGLWMLPWWCNADLYLAVNLVLTVWRLWLCATSKSDPSRKTSVSPSRVCCGCCKHHLADSPVCEYCLNVGQTLTSGHKQEVGALYLSIYDIFSCFSAHGVVWKLVDSSAQRLVVIPPVAVDKDQVCTCAGCVIMSCKQ